MVSRLWHLHQVLSPSRNCLQRRQVLTYLLCPSSNIVSNRIEDLPEPDTPVTNQLISGNGEREVFEIIDSGPLIFIDFIRHLISCFGFDPLYLFRLNNNLSSIWLSGQKVQSLPLETFFSVYEKYLTDRENCTICVICRLNPWSVMRLSLLQPENFHYYTSLQLTFWFCRVVIQQSGSIGAIILLNFDTLLTVTKPNTSSPGIGLQHLESL